MAKLVAHLEHHGYVRRVDDPADARARLVQVTDRGHEVFAIAHELVEELERRLVELLGAAGHARLRADVEACGASHWTSEAGVRTSGRCPATRRPPRRRSPA